MINMGVLLLLYIGLFFLFYSGSVIFNFGFVLISFVVVCLLVFFLPVSICMPMIINIFLCICIYQRARA